MHVGQVPSICRPCGAGFVARPVTQSPLQAGPEVDLPEVEAGVAAIGREHEPLAVGMPGGMKIEILRGADLLCRSVDQVVQPDAVVIVDGRAERDARRIGRPAGTLHRPGAGVEQAGLAALPRQNPEAAREVHDDAPVGRDVDRQPLAASDGLLRSRDRRGQNGRDDEDHLGETESVHASGLNTPPSRRGSAATSKPDCRS